MIQCWLLFFFFAIFDGLFIEVFFNAFRSWLLFWYCFIFERRLDKFSSDEFILWQRFLFFLLEFVSDFVEFHHSPLAFVLIQKQTNKLFCLTAIFNIAPKRLIFSLWGLLLFWFLDWRSISHAFFERKEALFRFLTTDVSQNISKLIYHSFNYFLVSREIAD